MSSKSRKPKRASRLPAIVPRFIKSAVTIGAIPALIGCDKGTPKKVQPVVAQYVDPRPAVVAAYAPDAEMPVPVSPVVAAMVPNQPPPSPPRDAGVDAATKKKPPKVAKPPPPVVAALVAPPLRDRPPPPPVVAAMLPNQNEDLLGPTPPQPSPKKTKKP